MTPVFEVEGISHALTAWRLRHLSQDCLPDRHVPPARQQACCVGVTIAFLLAAFVIEGFIGRLRQRRRGHRGEE